MTATEVPIVTTHGLRRYTLVSMAVGGSDVLQPMPPEARTVVMHMPPPTLASTAGVCHVALEDIDNLLIAEYELSRTASGTFKHVRFVEDAEVYEVHYQNAEQRRSVCLGRFVHAATAALAHAIARSNDADPRFRCVPYAVQTYIESIIRVREQQPAVIAQNTSAAEQAVAGLSEDHTGGGFELSLDDLMPIIRD